MYFFQSLIFLFCVENIVEAAPKFKANASQFMDVGFNKGRTGTRLAEIAVKFRPEQMLEDGENVHIEDLVLEVKSGDDCWMEVEERPVKRGKDKQMWRVKVVPCKQHLLRIGIKREECIEYFEYPAPVGPATAEEIANSHFRPSMPENVAITPLTEDSAVVSWTPSACAESYELWYESDDERDSGNMTVSAGFGSVTVRGLKNCTAYTMYVTALVGDEFSNAGEGEFTTCDTGHTDIQGTPAEDIDNTCEQVHRECEIEKPRPILMEDEAINVNETQLELKSDPEARIGRPNSSSAPKLCCFLVVLMSLLW